jgi:hypothetical protein
MIRGASTKIPHAREQGIFSAEQGIKVPCSAENRDTSRLTGRLPDANEPQTDTFFYRHRFSQQ